MFEMIQPLDNSILLWIQENLHSSILDTLMVAYTTLGNASLMWLLIAAIMVYFPKSRKAGIMVLFALILGYLLNNEFLKELIKKVVTSRLFALSAVFFIMFCVLVGRLFKLQIVE